MVPTVTSLTTAFAKAGVMFRDGTGTSAAFADVVLTPTGGILFQYRATGGPPGGVTVAGIVTPTWLKLIRTGNTFTAFYATVTTTPKANEWIVIGSTVITFANTNYEAGLALVSKDNTKLATATFDNFTITTHSLPTGWTDGDIGPTGKSGSASYDLNTYTVDGAGADIYCASDSFNYARTSVTGDNILIARLDSLNNTHASAKGGIMFRDSGASNSPFVILDVKPNGGIEFMSRRSAGANVVYSAGALAGASPTPATPVWLKLIKSGTSYAAYYATGTGIPVTWTQVGSAITANFFNATYLAGLVVTSHDTTKINAATFRGVNIGANPIGHTVGIRLYNNNYFGVNASKALAYAGYTSLYSPTEFQVIDAGGGNVALKNLSTGFYVRYDAADQQLKADIDTTIGANNLFQWVPIDPTHIALFCMATGKYVGINWDNTVGAWAGNYSTYAQQTQFTWTTVN